MAQNLVFSVRYIWLYRLYMRLVSGSEKEEGAKRQVQLVKRYYFFIWLLLINQSLVLLASYIDFIFDT